MTEPRIPAATYTPGQGDPVPRYRRNPRRAYDREKRKIRPMTLANAVDSGATAIRATCPPPCRPEGELPISRFSPEIAVLDVGQHLRCSACGRNEPVTEPVWPRW